MPTSLSRLVDKLSEINKKECNACIERKDIRSECEFIELKNNKLSYKYKECNKKRFKPVNELIKNFFKRKLT